MESFNLPGFDTIDDATAALIIQLQCEEIEALQSSRKGKNREDETPDDSDIAMGSFLEELRQMNTILSDRNFAERLNAGGETIPPVEGPPSDQTQDDLLRARLAALDVSGTEDKMPDSAASQTDEISCGEPSALATSRSNTPKAIYYDYISCGDSKRESELFQAACEHCYCQQCLTTMFELSTRDELLYPPRCCDQTIPLEFAKLYLNSTLIDEFQVKSVEFNTVDRTYCSKPTCFAFIAPNDGAFETSTATCTLCNADTCTICKGSVHEGDCPEDTQTQEVLAMAQEHAWRRCSNCRRLVIHDGGCYHMTCHCRTQFCYVCGAKWKTCACPQWDEDRLLEGAERFVARDRPQPQLPAPERALRVQEVVARLRNHHNCNHRDWEHIRVQAVSVTGMQQLQEP